MSLIYLQMQWLFISLGLLFLSQPPILNFLVQVWCPLREIPQIPPIHHGNSSSPHPFSNELVLFFPDPLLIQTSISVNFCLWHHNSQCHLPEFMLWSPSWYFYQISHISLLFPLQLSPFYPKTGLANLLCVSLDFPGSSGVKIPCFQCRGQCTGLVLGWGTRFQKENK